MHLHPSASATGASLISCDTLGSTNAEALSRARVGARGPLWIAAAQQTAGRGRRGNVWTSEAGNLYASLLLSDAAPAVHLPELCFVVALAARDAVAAAGPAIASELKLKWPNDLLLDGRKLAGLLIEAESIGGRTATVAGIGVNCAHHPRDTDYPATDLAAHGVSVAPDELFRELSAAMFARLRNGIAARASRRSARSGCHMLPGSVVTSCAATGSRASGKFEIARPARAPDAAPARRSA